MTELALTRSGDDRRRYELAGYGSIRRSGWASRDSELRTTTGRVYVARPRGWTQRTAEAVDQVGSVVGEFRQRKVMSHAGDVAWTGLPHEISRESVWRGSYVLTHHGARLLAVKARGWGRTPAVVTLDDRSVDAGLVLFSVWLVQSFVAQDAASASG